MRLTSNPATRPGGLAFQEIARDDRDEFAFRRRRLRRISRPGPTVRGVNTGQGYARELRKGGTKHSRGEAEGWKERGWLEGVCASIRAGTPIRGSLQTTGS